ncbi:PIG-L family deacetylase [Xylanimonas protaetiae]|uniref:GlcNAc-PI de-N-acetylase n=1 Tax=Xylanimonas protaetiae TaxID=2509457 RepID=A0A4P6F7P7_9MICO|nr:PIG-L family deacetylase [Xylanimonas protaetiae]QAY70319.1 GlcNAc-PI de-N-acetylase [Xylanimonas protaetiae]
MERLGRGVLAVHAHPDDETLSTGALLATAVAAGLPALVVTCTRGERGEVLALPGTASEGLAGLEGDGPALAAHREHELAAALVALGGVRHVFLDQVPPGGGRFEDSGMVWLAPGVAGPDPAVPAGFAVVPLDDAAGRLARVIREARPTVVATYEAGGGYGHPDHVRAHQVAARAVALAAAPGFDDASAPWQAELWLRVAAAGDLRRQRAALFADARARALAQAAGLTFPGPDEPLPAVARDDALLAQAAAAGQAHDVDVDPVLPAVVAAMRAHATQIQHAQTAPGEAEAFLGWYALSNGVLAPIGPRETYLVADPAPAQATSVGSAP